MILAKALEVGLLISALLSMLIFASLYYNPRLWIGDAPKEMQEAVEPLSRREKIDRIAFGIPVMLVAFGIPVVSLLNFEALHGSVSFVEAFTFLYVAMMVFNVIDLLIIDWLVVVIWQPKVFTIPGVEHLMHLNNFNFHFRGFLKGTVGIGVVSGIVALIFYLL